MPPLLFLLIAFAISILAGIFGALLGLGGGIIVVPALTLLLGIDIKFAIGASIVAVIATSSGAAASYVKEHMTNLRLAMFLEMATAAGALTGAYVSGLFAKEWLFILFAVVLGYAGLAMFRDRLHVKSTRFPPDPVADRLKLHGAYFDASANELVQYRVTRSRTGLALSYVAGIVSGLLGVGGGIMKVPAMNLAMRMPIKAATATSNFMIGVTAAASAGVWFARGDIDPFVAAPVAAGVLIGATVGSRLMSRLRGNFIRWLFLVVLLFTMVQMMYRGIHGLTAHPAHPSAPAPAVLVKGPAHA